jgi:uncharacterized BrkB/YihY/UPF0761 family membrane protein
MAAELTLFALFSALPLLLVAVAGLGVLENLLGLALASDVEIFIKWHITRVLGAQTPVLDLVSQLFKSSNGATITVGLLASLYGASRVLISLVSSLDIIFTPVPQRRGWFAIRFRAAYFACASMVVLLLSILLLAAGGRLVRGLYGDGPLALVAAKTVSLLGYISAILWLAWLYVRLPKRSLSLKQQLPGAVLAVSVGDLAGRLLRHWFFLLDTNAIFGSIASAFALLWWIYGFASVVVFGAIWNAWRNEPVES